MGGAGIMWQISYVAGPAGVAKGADFSNSIALHTILRLLSVRHELHVCEKFVRALLQSRQIVFIPGWPFVHSHAQSRCLMRIVWRPLLINLSSLQLHVAF